MASGNGVLNAIVRQKPAMERIKLNVAAILTSLVRNCPLVRSLSVPNARPRITNHINGKNNDHTEKHRDKIKSRKKI